MMRLFQFSVIATTALLFGSIAMATGAPAGASIEGEYTCLGKDSPNDQSYSEKMSISNKAGMYEIKWTPQDESPYIGMASLSDDGKKLYSSYVKVNSAKSNGLMILSIAGTKLSGKYADFNGTGLVGTYSCER